MTSKTLFEQTVSTGWLVCCVVMAFTLGLATPPTALAEMLQSLHYTYDEVGNVARIGDQITLPNTQTLTYDDLDRLLTANGPYGTGGAPDTITYTYNELGNILTNSQLTGGTFTYPTSGAGVVRPHAVQSAGPYQYSYDNNGNQTGITSTLGDYGSSTTFNVDNRMASAVTTFGSTTVNSTFVYDGDGGRVKKTVQDSTGTHVTRYISKLYECETTGANTSCSRFIWVGDTRIATVATNGTVHYWHRDHLGSSSVITDSTGAKVQALTYSPYGGVRTNQSFTTPAVDVPYKFTGKEFDYSTDFYYYESRYYDPWFGRFISPDTIVPYLDDPQSLNRYAYARNNPMLYTDPSGHIFGIDDLIIVAIVIGATVGAVSSGIQSDWDLQAILLGGVIGGVSAGVGFGTFGPASAAFASLGDIGSGIAGGAVAGAVAGGTSGALAMAAGYKVNIGLAIASGAAAGGITGGAYGQWGQWGAFAAAPAAGASGAAISGADPGMGAAIAAATAAFALGVQQLAQQLAPAQMSRGGSPSGNILSMRDVGDALDVIGKSTFVTDPPAGFTDAPGIAAKLNAMFKGGNIGFGQTYKEGARAEYWFGKITLNPNRINLGLCPKCDLPGTLFHEGVHAFYGDRFSSPFNENRAYSFQRQLEIRLYDEKAPLRPLTRP